MTQQTDVKRYNLALPTPLYEELKGEADRRAISVVELLRKFIKLGLVASKLEDDPESSLIIREGSERKEREIVFY